MTKASEARRKRRFERRGRPTGSYKSLLKDPQRFSIATWLTFEPIGSHVAARLAAAWIEEVTPISIETVEGLLLRIGADYKPPISDKASRKRSISDKASRTRDLDRYASQLAEKARLAASRATELESAWLDQSSGALVGLMTFIMDGDAVGFDQAIKVLRQSGWDKILDRIGRRLAPALRAEFPSFEGRLSATAQHVLAILRAAKT